MHDSIFMEFVGTLTVEITSSMSTVINYIYTQLTKSPPPRTFENCPKKPPTHNNKITIIKEYIYTK